MDTIVRLAVKLGWTDFADYLTANADLEITLKEKRRLRKMFIRKQLRMFREEIPQMEARIEAANNSYGDNVYLYNVGIVQNVGDDEFVVENHDKLILERKEFEQLTSEGRIQCHTEKGIGFTRGAVDQSDLSLQDFSDGEIEVETGNRVIEVITEDDFLAKKTGYRGINEILEERMRSEIQVGLAWNYADAILNVASEEELHGITIYEPNASDFGRGKNEQRYYFNKINDLLKDAKSHGELYKGCAGILFPTTVTSQVMSGTNKVEFMLLTDRSRFTHPAGILHRLDREVLLATYKVKVEEFKAEKENLIDEIKELANTPSNIMPYQISQLLTAEKARSVLRQASQLKREKGENVFPYPVWKIINTLAFPKAKPVIEDGLLDKLNDIASVTKEDASKIISFAQFVMHSEGKKLLTREQYAALCNKRAA